MDDLVYDTFRPRNKNRNKLPKNNKNVNSIKNRNKHKKQNPLIKFLRFCINITMLSAVLAFVLIALTFIFYSTNLPGIKELSNITPEDSNVKVLDTDNKMLADFGAIHSTETTYSDLPVNLINAVIATEDRKFFKHRGVDLMGMVRAGYVNIFSGKIKQGGSTITQQLAKMLLLTPERTLERKMKEMILALRLERAFSKQEILALYLNKAYFGSGQYGISSASKFYFNKKIPHFLFILFFIHTNHSVWLNVLFL